MAFQRATRKKAKLRLAILGPSGAGKTYSAIKIAMGLGGKIAMIDSERGSGELYAHLCEYDVCGLVPPFTPEKYIEAIHEAERAGYSVIIIDSLSHAWSGTGGLLEDVDKRKGQGNDFTAWRTVTPRHNALVDAMLSSPCHIIGTMRTKQEHVLVDEVRNGKTVKVPKKVGLQPVQRDGLEYEFTVVLDVDLERHMASASKDRTSLFDGQFFTPTEETGKSLIAWLDAGAEDPLAKIYNLGAIEGAMAHTDTIAALTDYLRSLSVPDGHKQRPDIAALYQSRKAQLDFATPLPSSPSGPTTTPAPITDDQRKYIQAHFNGWDRDRRLANLSDFLGRKIGSVNDMTKDEASGFIDAVESEKEQAHA